MQIKILFDTNIGRVTNVIIHMILADEIKTLFDTDMGRVTNAGIHMISTDEVDQN